MVTQKVNFKKILSLMTLLSIIPLSTFAGGSHGGGGGVVHCEIKPQIIATKDKDGNIRLGVEYDQKLAQNVGLSHGRKYQLTDLWEAENGYGPFRDQIKTRGRNLNMIYDDKTPIEIQIERALTRLTAVNPEFGHTIGLYLTMVQLHIVSIPTGAYVLPPQDTDIRYLKRGCETVGLGMYSDIENNLVIDPDVSTHLSKVDFAAFFVHEAVYKALRDIQHIDTSWSTRKIVGYLFSEDSFTWADLVSP